MPSDKVGLRFCRDNLEENSKNLEISSIIHDVYYSNKTPPFRQRILFLISTLFSFLSIFLIGKIQVDNFNALVNNRTLNLNETLPICQAININNVNYFSVALAFLLILLYVTMYKRRVFLIKLCRFRNMGLPMIVSCWNKTDRLYTSLTYGVIAFNIYAILRDSELVQNNNSKSDLKSIDVTGLIRLLYKIFEMLVIGLSNKKIDFLT